MQNKKLMLLILIFQICLFLTDAIYRINISQRVEKLENCIEIEKCIETEKTEK